MHGDATRGVAPQLNRGHLQLRAVTLQTQQLRGSFVVAVDLIGRGWQVDCLLARGVVTRARRRQNLLQRLHVVAMLVSGEDVGDGHPQLIRQSQDVLSVRSRVNEQRVAAAGDEVDVVIHLAN